MKAIDYKALAKAAKEKGLQDVVNMHIENFKRVQRKLLAKKKATSSNAALE